MEKDVSITRVNASTVMVSTADAGINEDIYDYFKYQEPTFKPNKFRKWDGVVRLYNKRDGTLPYGLLQPLFALVKDRQWSMDLDPRFKQDITDVSREELADWVKELKLHSGGKPIEPYDYQMEALYLSIRYGRLVLLAATSAGKSLIQYMLIRYYEMLGANDQLKSLLIVPSINLVSQMYNDFKDYSSVNGWNVDQMVHCVQGGIAKHTHKPVVISTWQSLFKLDDGYFQQYGRVLCDEVHLASADSISKIMKACTNAYQRIGLTGTLKADILHPLMVQSHFGPIKRIVTTRELIDAGRATATQITLLNLKYPDGSCMEVSNMSHHEEIEYLINHPYRNKVIESLIMGLKGNSLLLFGRVETHLQVICDNINAKNLGKKVFIISGEVPGKTRDAIKAAIEAGEDIALLATYGTMSTGVSIKKLHNLVFCHPVKSVITVLQSIGRMIRLHDSKDVANIYDIVDDLRFLGNQNYTFGWALQRFSYYSHEKHPVSSKKYAVPA